MVPRGSGETWVQRVARTSNAMDLPLGVFNRTPRAIARGLKESVLASQRTKGTKFQSAMSMLNFYINRAGRGLGARDRARLEKAKDELRKLFGRPPRRGPGSGAPGGRRRGAARRARRARALPRTLT